MDPSPSPTSSSTASAGQHGYNPHSNRGRKKTNEDAPSRKAELNRNAQRALRDRKKQYVTDLETKVAELTAALKEAQSGTTNPKPLNLSQSQTQVQPTPQHIQELEALRKRNVELQIECQMFKHCTASAPILAHGCLSCAAERMKNAICTDQIVALERLVYELKASQQTTIISTPPQPMQLTDPFLFDIQQSPFHFSNSSLDGAMNLDFLLEESEDKKTSEQLYGPIEVESFIITIKALPSLKERGTFIDNYFELAVKETRITSQKAARKLLIEFVRRGKQLIDFTSIMDRHKLMEIFSIFHERNAKHEIHFSNLCAPSEETRRQYANRPLGQLPAPVQAFRDTMKAVPSFKDHGEIIDQVCSFWVYECDAEGFFVLNYLLYQLEILSKSVEDRTKFWVAFEIVRHSGQSSNTLEDLIAQVENASL